MTELIFPGTASVERQSPLSVLKLLSAAASLAYFSDEDIIDAVSRLDKHLKASVGKRRGSKPVRAQLLEEQQATFAIAAAAAKGMQLVAQAGSAGVLSANPFGLASVARMCSNTSCWADLWRFDDDAACQKLQRHMTITGLIAALPAACAAVAGALQQLPQQPPDTDWPCSVDPGMRLLFTTELACELLQLFDSAYVCWMDAASLNDSAKPDCFEGFKQALGPAYCMQVASLALQSLLHWNWLQDRSSSSSSGSLTAAGSSSSSSIISSSRNSSAGSSRRNRSSTGSNRHRGARQAISSNARVASRPSTAMQQHLVWAALRTACGVAVQCQHSSQQPAADAADEQLLQSLADGDVLLLFAASMATYTRLLHRDRRGKSPMVAAGPPSSSSSSPTAASRRRQQQQLKSVPEHRAQLLELLGMPALANAPKGDGHSEDTSAKLITTSCGGFLHPLLCAYVRLAEQQKGSSAPIFPSKEQQLLHHSIVAVAGELALLAPEGVRPAAQLAGAAVSMYMCSVDAAAKAYGPSHNGAADAALARLFAPMAQLLSPALVYVADGSSSREECTSSDLLDSLFTLVLGVCAKCAFDINTDIGLTAARRAFKDQPLALCCALEATIRGYSSVVSKSEGPQKTNAPARKQDNRLITAVLTTCQAAAAAGELAAAVAEDRRLGPRLLALAVSCLKCGNAELSNTAAAAAAAAAAGASGEDSAHSSSARRLAVFFTGSIAAALGRDLLVHSQQQLQQQQIVTAAAAAAGAAADIDSSSSNQHSFEPCNWLMLIGRGFATAGAALKQCCTPLAAAATITAAAAAAAAVFGDIATGTAAAQLDNTEWISNSQHPLQSLQHMSAVVEMLGPQLQQLSPEFAAGLQQQQQELHASLKQATTALLAARLDDVLPGSVEAELNIAAVMQAMQAVNSQAPGGQLLQLSKQLSTFGAALCAAVPVRCCCNNPGCGELSGACELELVAGKSSRCSGYRVARYHSVECLKAHWKQHKLVCRAIAAQQ